MRRRQLRRFAIEAFADDFGGPLGAQAGFGDGSRADVGPRDRGEIMPSGGSKSGRTSAR